MNFRNKYLLITVRTLAGLMFVFSGITGFFAASNNMQGIPEPMIPYMHSLYAAGIFQMIKATEIIAGLMLLLGFLPALAAILLAPICIGVLVFNGSIAPGFIAGGIIATAFDSYLGYAYWDKYKQLFQRKTK